MAVFDAGWYPGFSRPLRPTVRQPPPPSANERLPAGPWVRTWLAALAVAATLLCGFEAFWRSRGFTPSVTDDAALWAYTRARLRPSDAEAVALIGSSRIRMGIDSATWAEAHGSRPPVQLAVNGSSCLPVLDHLARDPNFRGLVVCDATLRVWFREGDPYGGTQAEYVRHYEVRPAAAAVEEPLRILVQSALVSRLPALAPGRLFEHLRTGVGLPKPDYLITDRDRSIHADFARLDVPEAVRGRGNEERIRRTKFGATPDGFRWYLTRVEAAVRAIRARGGEVAFVVLPTSGTVRALEEELYPRRLYWDVLVASTAAIAVHFEDYPALAAFTCPDGSHLDERDSAEYTRRLSSVLAGLRAARRAAPRRG